MKRKFMSALLIVAATCFTVSCEKDDKDNQSNTNSKFSGTIEQLASDAKTVLGARDIVKWCPGDTIAVNGRLLYATITDTSTTTGFAYVAGQEALTESSYTAYYPASIYNNGNPTLPAVQKYTEGRIDNLPMYAYSTTTTLQFHNICGVMELNLTGTGNKRVKSISVTAMDNSTALNGRFTVDANNKAVISSCTQASQRTVTLDCGTGVQLDPVNATKFWIALPEIQSKQLLLTIRATDGTCLQKKTLGNVILEANHIREINMDLNNDAEFKKMSGYFQGAGNRIIQFACGNLRKETSTSPYSFFPNQIGGFVNSEDSSARQNVDLFTYRTLSAMDFKTTINDTTWEVLSKADWESVIGIGTTPTRPGSTVNGSAGCRFAKVTIDGFLYAILCPDNAVITGAAPISYWNSATEITPLTNDEWQVFEEAGCVFLPGAGMTNNNAKVYHYNEWGIYWSSTPDPDPSKPNNAYDFVFKTSGDNAFSMTSNEWVDDHRHFSVRLAQKF